MRGSCLAVTSPRVFEVATGERIGFEELGGVDVHARMTGQIDLGVDTDEEAWTAVRRWLSYLPSNAWTPPPGPLAKAAPGARSTTTPAWPSWSPCSAPAATTCGACCGRLLDPVSFFELRPLIGRNLTTGFGRIDGWPVGVVASNPMFQAGALDGDACEKATRLLVLCDSFDIPVCSCRTCPASSSAGWSSTAGCCTGPCGCARR